jgi:hypothetical protein
MSSESDYLKDLRDASIRTAVEHLRIVHRLRQCGAGDERSADGDERAHPEPGSMVGDLLFDVARLQLNTYNNLLGLSAQYGDRLANDLRAALAPTRAATPRRRRIALRGHLGDRARPAEPLVIENRLPTPATVTLSVSQFQRADGGGTFGARVDFEPADECEPRDAAVRRLEPGERRAFQVAVTLDTPFEPGQHYRSELFVILRERVVERVDLELEVAPHAP